MPHAPGASPSPAVPVHPAAAVVLSGSLDARGLWRQSGPAWAVGSQPPWATPAWPINHGLGAAIGLWATLMAVLAGLLLRVWLHRGAGKSGGAPAHITRRGDGDSPEAAQAASGNRAARFPGSTGRPDASPFPSARSGASAPAALADAFPDPDSARTSSRPAARTGADARAAHADARPAAPGHPARTLPIRP